MSVHRQGSKCSPIVQQQTALGALDCAKTLGMEKPAGSWRGFLVIGFCKETDFGRPSWPASPAWCSAMTCRDPPGAVSRSRRRAQMGTLTRERPAPLSSPHWRYLLRPLCQQNPTWIRFSYLLTFVREFCFSCAHVIIELILQSNDENRQFRCASAGIWP